MGRGVVGGLDGRGDGVDGVDGVRVGNEGGKGRDWSWSTF